MTATTATAPPRASRAPLLVLGALSLVVVACLLYLGRGRTFFFDEWNFVLRRSPGGVDSGGLDLFMVPHNEHWAAIPVGIYRTGFALLGIDDAWPYRVLVALVHVGTCLIVYLLARPRIGDWPALLPALAALGLFVGHENLLWGFQIGFVGAVTFGLGALYAVERGTRRADVAACLLLLASVMTQGTWVAMWVCVTVVLLLGRHWRRLWIPGIPLVVYAAWYVGWSEGTKHGTHLADAPGWAVDAAAGTLAGITGDGSGGYGPALLVLVGALLVVHIVRRRPPGSDPRLWGLLLGAAALWLVVGYGRADTIAANASRYVGVSGYLVVLILTELLRPVRFGRRELAVGFVLVGMFAIAGIGEMVNRAAFLREYSSAVRAELAALELIGIDRVPRDLVFDDPRVPGETAGPYLATVRQLGSSAALPAGELPKASAVDRREADRVLLLTGALNGLPSGPRPPADAPVCAVRQPGEEVALPAGGVLWVRAGRTGGPSEIAVRRFSGSVDHPPVATVAPGASVELRPPADASPVPYMVQVRGGGTARICTSG